MNNDRMENAISFIKIGYGDTFSDNWSFRCLQFVTEDLATHEAQALIRLVKQYNEFNGELVASALDEFRNRISAYKFGRESSPVLYVRLPHFTNQIEGQISHQVGKKISESDHNAIVQALRDTFVEKLGAEEFELIGKYRHDIRIWWG